MRITSHFLSMLSKKGVALLLCLVCLTALLSACGASSDTNQAGGTTEILYTYTTFSGAPKDLSAVQDAINALPAMKDAHLKVKLEPIDYAAYDQKMKLRFSSGQPCDAVFTASWANNFYTNVAQGNLLQLDDLLTKYAPHLAASMPKEIFDAGRSNGKLYAVPNQQLFPKYWGVIIRKDLAQKYNLDVNSLHTYSDLEPFLARIKANEPGVTPLYSDDQLGGTLYHYETYGIDDVYSGVGVNINDSSLKAFNYFDTSGFRESAQLAHKWYQAGYYLKNPLPAADAIAAFKAGKFAVYLDQARPEEPQKFKASFGYDEVQTVFEKPFLNTESIAATMTGICRSSQHAAQTMQFLDMLNSNKDLYNLLCHGIEGRDYTFADKSKGVITVPSNSAYNPNTDWMFGNQFNSYYTDPSQSQADLWNVSQQLNSQATRSVALGFAFDPTSVKTQVAQVSAVVTQYATSIEKGLVDPNTAIPQFLSALKAAGVDDVVAAAQTQLDAWKKSK